MYIYILIFVNFPTLAGDKCDKAYADLRDLNSHIQVIHEGIKNYKCHKCDFGCGLLSGLKKHIAVVHDGIRKYRCEKCDKATR